MQAHPTAVIHSATRLAEDISVGAYAVIEDGVEIGAGCIIREHAVIRSGSILGAQCVVDAHAVVGGLPQDLHFKPSIPSGVRLGDRVVLREGVTISRATREGTFTEIGADAFLMACSHVGHDCRVGKHVVLANAVLLAGHVQIGDHSFIGGAAAVHQHGRIGESAMVSGLSRASMDMPPFCMMAERNELIGLNLLGLKRRGFSREVIRELKRLYQEVLCASSPREAATRLLAGEASWSAQGRQLLEFVAAPTRRGLVRPRRGSEE